jgi:hypothetical protein
MGVSPQRLKDGEGEVGVDLTPTSKLPNKKKKKKIYNTIKISLIHLEI